MVNGRGEVWGANRRWGLVWLGLLALIAGELALVALRVATYPSLLRWPGAAIYIAEPVVALAGYGVVIALAPLLVARLPGLREALWIGTLVGVFGGALELVDIAVESLAPLPQRAVAISTGGAMLALFTLFAVAGFAGARRSQRFWLGLAAAIWCAMVVMLIAVAFGFILANVALPQLAQTMIGDPDYLRSGWTDPSAFAIANTFDNGFTHLVEAPIIAAITGSVGAGLSQLTRRRPAIARA